MTSTGFALVKSDERAMREPVTMTVSAGSSVVCCASVGAARLDAKAPPMSRRKDCLFIFEPSWVVVSPSPPSAKC
jgi:hypothetical protein